MINYTSFKSFFWLLFCLMEQCEYVDSIEFQGKDGNFQVCLRATIPCHALEVPDSVLLPVCAVEHSTHTTFRLKNARYMWLFLTVYIHKATLESIETP